MVDSVNNFWELLNVFSDDFHTVFSNFQVFKDSSRLGCVLVLHVASSILGDDQSSLSVNDRQAEIELIRNVPTILFVFICSHIHFIQECKQDLLRDFESVADRVNCVVDGVN